MSITESVNFYLHNASQIKTKPKIHQSRRIYPSPTLDATLNTFFCKTIEQVVIWLNYTFFSANPNTPIHLHNTHRIAAGAM